MDSRTIRYGVLGSLSIQRDGSPVPLNAPTLRYLLGLLLARANHPVTTDHLIAVLWAETAPPRARKALQVYIHRLRQALGDQARISYEHDGYMLATSKDEVDANEFSLLVSEARARRREGELEKAAEILRQALELWRGPAFEDLAEHPLISDEARRLDEERTRVTTEQIEIELDLGRHIELIPRLAPIAESHPFREDIWRYLMLALYRAGRQTEALEAFHRISKVLCEELALEPGTSLRQMHTAILRSSPDLDLRRNEQSAPVPRELPPAVAGFSGRSSELAALDSLIAGSCTSVRIALVTGTGGVGKTATVLHWAHRVASRFPDGQLYVDLRGYATDERLRPIDALTGFLRALGVPPHQIPLDPAEAAALYRSRLSGQRVLVVLDNARSAADVRLLLPGTSSCLAVITSRDRLTGLIALDGAVRVPLNVLSPAEARALIADLLDGSSRRLGSKAIDDLASACAYLPLALRIAIAHMLDRPYEDIAVQVARLRQGSVLAKLAITGDDAAAIRSTFELSYRAVAKEAQLMFRRLGLMPCPHFTAETAAVLTNLPLELAAELLERLTDAHLISTWSTGRYVIHDLLREFAQETCHTVDSTDELAAATERVCNLYLDCISAAGRLLYPAIVRLPRLETEGKGFVDTEGAMGWLDSEHTNVAAAIRYASQHGPRSSAWLLADGLRGYFDHRRHLRIWFTTARAGLIAARADGDASGQGAMFHMLGHAYGVAGLDQAARANFDRALKMTDQCGDLQRLAGIYGSYGAMIALTGQLALAQPMILQAQLLFRDLGRRRLEAVALNNLAAASWGLGNLNAALEYCSEAANARSELGQPSYIAMSNLGAVLHLLGRHHQALEVLQRALAGIRSVGHLAHETFTLIYLGAVLRDVGRWDEARDSLTLAIRHARGIGFNQALVAGLTELGTHILSTGHPADAHEVLEEAVETGKKVKVRFETVGALIALANAQRAIGTAAALASAQEALDLAIEGQFRLRQGQALVAIARLRLSEGNTAQAIALATEALEIQQETGHLIGAAEARSVLACAHPDPVVAAEHGHSARAIYEQTGVLQPRDLPTR